MSNQIISLSYELNESTPAYNNDGGFVRKELTSISAGRTANSEYWAFNNHLGTHIDFPYHFNNNGKSLSDYEPSFFWINNVAVLNIQVAPGEVITEQHLLQQVEPLNNQLEAIFLNTGFGSYRNEEVYWKEGPAFHPELYNFLRNQFPKLKFFGFDAISLTSLVHRVMGKEAHQAFLLNNDPILIIEDVNFAQLPHEVKIIEMVISPLQVSKADGTPVNIMAKIN